MQIPPIYIAGSGNLAWHLTHAFVEAHLPLAGIWSRNIQNAKELANSACTDLINKEQFINGDGLFFLCVPDDSIESIAQLLKNKTIVHCAAAVHIQQLLTYSAEAGVFYPLQTFTKYSAISFNNIPILIESSTSSLLSTLFEIATKLQSKPQIINSEQRLQIHLAAILSNNFTNYLITLAQDYLSKHNLDPALLNSLLIETIHKAIKIGGKAAQTGPAIRNDQQTIEKHLNLLNHHPELKKLYSFVTMSITQYFKNHESETKF
ncbi:MAG: DUF2520 domain-containing protein [Bacteroidales bacterium]|nr:DUF2520 domain-containing protein [Bacteroidales bacterium]